MSWLGLPKKFFNFLYVLTRGFVTIKTGMDKANLAGAVDEEGRGHAMNVGGRDELVLGIANNGERDLGGFEKPLHVLRFFVHADGDDAQPLLCVLRLQLLHCRK